MSQLDQITYYVKGEEQCLSPGVKGRLKELIIELISDDEEPKFRHDEATYGDTDYDHASAIYGRNELRDELCRKVEKL